MEGLVREFPKLDPFEGVDEFTVWLAKFIARMKWRRCRAVGLKGSEAS